MTGPSQSFEGYTAIERLTSGPMTAVYCATQQLIGRKVVIKTLSAGILPDSAFGQNIEREATILATLNHPSIVALHDLRRGDGIPWLVREWVPGWTVSDLLPRLRRFTPGLALGIATQIAHALAHAHANGIVHRGLH
ncbi:MAG TPA: protein kinase, partial [Polyangiaceae bacterium]|nr:protein kinase [Polyangiaceae bacterium]